jgi:carbonic anhydrase
MPVIGTRQSPIKLVTKDAMPLAKPDDVLRIEYKDKDYHGTFIGIHPSHGNFELDQPVKPDTYPSVLFQGNVFELRRIHIHFKSEHVIDSIVQRDYEVHLVHARQGMTLSDPKVVIGILYHESATTPAGKGLERFNDLLRKRAAAGLSLRAFKATDSIPDGDINPLEFFPRLPDGKSPDLKNWFHYEGSLTSEPYSEDVSWFVMKNESKIDPKKLEELEKYAEQEARPTYALDRRIIVRSF